MLDLSIRSLHEFLTLASTPCFVAPPPILPSRLPSSPPQISEFRYRVESGALRVHMGDLSRSMQAYVNPDRPRAFFEKLVSKEALNARWKDVLLPRLPRARAPGRPAGGDAGAGYGSEGSGGSSGKSSGGGSEGSAAGHHESDAAAAVAGSGGPAGEL